MNNINKDILNNISTLLNDLNNRLKNNELDLKQLQMDCDSNINVISKDMFFIKKNLNIENYNKINYYNLFLFLFYIIIIKYF